jgi:hypothetical protein
MQQSSLIVRPICAKLTRDTEIFSKMDPYCVVTLGGQRQRTRTCHEAGKYPNWNESMVFSRTMEDMLVIAVFDEDIGRDDLVGETSFSLGRMTAMGTFEDWLQLSYKGRRAGEVRIGVQLAAVAGAGMPYGGYPAPAYNPYPQPQFYPGYAAYPPPPMAYPYPPPPMMYPPPQPGAYPAPYPYPPPPGAYPYPYYPR